MSDPNPELAECQTVAMQAMAEAFRHGRAKGFRLGMQAGIVATLKPERNELVDLLERQLTETRGAHAAVLKENEELRYDRRRLIGSLEEQLEEATAERIKASYGSAGNGEWQRLNTVTETLERVIEELRR